ncbi:MAG: hypothetical protein FLDDKLPJ_02726 [Phycisphaerae bacterium]|nr:hypothetical protein [Phycisphaerae bacterium]
MADPAAHPDPNNVPLSAEQEHRIAWLGAELQAMDADLARENKVSDRTSGDLTGVIVTYLCAGSPAQQADLRDGDILLRLHAA